MTTVTAPDYDAIKTRQQATWSSGDYAVIGTTLQIVGETLCEAVDIAAGERRARRRGRQRQRVARRRTPRRDVTASDYVPALLERHSRPRRRRRPDDRRAGGRRRSAAIRGRLVRRGAVDVRRDVHAQPGAVSGRARARLPSRWHGSASRTGRPMASSARCSRSSAATSPPPAGVRSPLEWGTEARLTELLGSKCSHARDPPQGLRVPLPLGGGLVRHVPRATTGRR